MSMERRGRAAQGARTVVTLAVGWVVSSCCAPGPEVEGGGTEAATGASAWRLIQPRSGLERWVQVLDSPWIVGSRGEVVRSEQDPSGRLDGESWLLSREAYDDFELELEFRIPAGGNSGVFIRDPVPRAERLAAPNGGPPPWEAGYEVNINGDEPNYPTGSVWALAKGRPGLQRDGEWNTLRIRIIGQQIWTEVNGEVALDGVTLPARSERGAIGLQRHGGEAFRDKPIEFRRIRIREL